MPWVLLLLSVGRKENRSGVVGDREQASPGAGSGDVAWRDGPPKGGESGGLWRESQAWTERH